MGSEGATTGSEAPSELTDVTNASQSTSSSSSTSPAPSPSGEAHNSSAAGGGGGGPSESPTSGADSGHAPSDQSQSHGENTPAEPATKDSAAAHSSPPNRTDADCDREKSSGDEEQPTLRACRSVGHIDCRRPSLKWTLTPSENGSGYVLFPSGILVLTEKYNYYYVFQEKLVTSNAIFAEALEGSQQSGGALDAAATRSVSALGAEWVRSLSPASVPRALRQPSSAQHRIQRPQVPPPLAEKAAASMEPEKSPSWRRPDSPRVQLLAALELDAGVEWLSQQQQRQHQQQSASQTVFNDSTAALSAHSSSGSGSLESLEPLFEYKMAARGHCAIDSGEDIITRVDTSRSTCSSRALRREHSAATSGYASLSGSRCSHMSGSSRRVFDETHAHLQTQCTTSPSSSH